MLFKKKSVFVLTLVLVLSVAAQISHAADLTLGYVEWDCAVSQTHIVAAVLEEHFDLDVDLISVDAGIMWTGLAQGDLDAIVSAWLPVTHGFYWDRYQDRLENLGPNFHGARIGLVVPAYVTIDSISELNKNAREFKSLIYGIDPGAGIMAATDDAIDVYGLRLSVLDSSDAAMVTQLGQSIAREEWIVITGWVPHWKFDAFDLKFLEDPEGVYGEEETINTVVRAGLRDDIDPEIMSFLENFYLTQTQLHEMMNRIRVSNEEPIDLARVWIQENSDLVDRWLEK